MARGEAGPQDQEMMRVSRDGGGQAGLRITLVCVTCGEKSTSAWETLPWFCYRRRSFTVKVISGQDGS